MANTFAVSRAQLIYALCLPLAVLVGYFLADPVEAGNRAVVVFVITLLCVPLLMRWHHPMLVLGWNAVVMPYFLPGRPYLWIVLAVVGLFFGVLNRFTNPDARFVAVPSVTRALLALTAVVVITAVTRGGLGIRLFGSAHYGGRNYVFVLAAVAGYFAFTSQKIPAHRAKLYLGLFFLSGFVVLVPNLAYLAGGRLDFLFYVFPAEMAIEQAMADFRLDTQFGRIYGLTLASIGLYSWVLSRYGIRGLLNREKPWRALLLLLAFAGCLFSGFRTSLILFCLVLAVQGWCEGLFRPRVLLVGGLAAALAGLIILPQAERLPLVMQRTLSFLPVTINPGVRQSADHSYQWRLDMWNAALSEVPNYLLRGKGYAFDPAEIAFATENSRRGYSEGFATALIVGDYHNGPLSVIIPFGIWGVLAFGWFIIVAIKYLYHNYRHGAPALRQINLFLFAYFIARVIFFLLVFGDLKYEFFVFTGLVGFGASLNGTGTAAPATDAQTQAEAAFDEEFASEQLR